MLGNREAVAIALALFGLVHAAKREKRAPPRLVRRHAVAHVVVEVQLQMTRDFGVELAIPARAAEQAGQPKQPYPRRPNERFPPDTTLVTMRLLLVGHTLPYSHV